MILNYGTSEMGEAYLALMDWDYDFLMQTGSIYNFITGQTSAEENPNYVPIAHENRIAEQEQRAQQELEQLQKELLNE
jgi:hypothetical protein